MAIKVTFNQSTTQSEKPFPKLRIFHYPNFGGDVLLFMRDNTHGVVLQILPDQDTGRYSGDVPGEFWETAPNTPGTFTDYNEPITLQNT